jgi:hypothetical protein
MLKRGGSSHANLHEEEEDKLSIVKRNADLLKRKHLAE